MRNILENSVARSPILAGRFMLASERRQTHSMVVLTRAVNGSLEAKSLTDAGSRAPTSAQAVTARTYRAEVSTVCERYNAEIMQIGRTPRGSREHEVQLARATNAVTASEARALMQISRPPGFGRLERLRAMASTANAADESTRLFSTGQLAGRAGTGW